MPRGRYLGKSSDDGLGYRNARASTIDIGEFDELDAAEKKLAQRAGLNMYDEPAKPAEESCWRRNRDQAKPPTPVDSVAMAAEARRAEPADAPEVEAAGVGAEPKLTSADLGMKWWMPIGLAEAIRDRMKDVGGKRLAAEFQVPLFRVYDVASKLRAKGMMGKLKQGRAGKGGRLIGAGPDEADLAIDRGELVEAPAPAEAVHAAVPAATDPGQEQAIAAAAPLWTRRDPPSVTLSAAQQSLPAPITQSIELRLRIRLEVEVVKVTCLDALTAETAP